MTAVPRPWTVLEFLDWERRQPGRHERVGGLVVARVGGTANHARIKGNLYSAIRSALSGLASCEVFVEGPKVIAGDNLTYPDLVVTCAPVAGKDDVVPDPVIVIEVMSRSTADYDRSGKWLGYQQLATLDQYILVSQEEARIEAYLRREHSWDYGVLTGLDGVLDLRAIKAVVPIAEIYERTSVTQG